MNIIPFVKTICAITVALAVLSGCGRKGALEPPAVKTDNPPAQGSQPAPQVPERRFILDGLLE